MNIEEQRAVADPVKGLEEILLNNSRLERMTKISTLANLPVRQALTTFLRENQDVFPWSYEDMLGIDPSIMVHRLNVSHSILLIRQKKRVFAQERDKAITKEFIKEVYYLDWLANVVMVKKANGTNSYPLS